MSKSKVLDYEEPSLSCYLSPDKHQWKRLKRASGEGALLNDVEAICSRGVDHDTCRQVKKSH